MADKVSPQDVRGDTDEYIKGGKGRKDDVRGSRIYPTSADDAPGDAEVRTVGDYVKHKGPMNKHPRGFKRAI